MSNKTPSQKHTGAEKDRTDDRANRRRSEKNLLAVSPFGLVALSILLSVSLGLCGCASSRTRQPITWPTATQTNRPWTRWWWLGSAVDEKNLTDLLGQYHTAGFGGVEICPIYGAKGYENRYIDFLSPKWMQMLDVTTRTAKQLGMGVDLTDGTGWPFGGPNVSTDDASSRLVLKKYEVEGGKTWSTTLPRGRVQCVMAYSSTTNGPAASLRDQINDGQINWSVPAGNWRVYAVLEQGPIQKVKRAAPGGEGNVLDPFSPRAMQDYLKRFDQAFANYHGSMPRAHFHDSYEYYGASWTPNFFDEFQKRRGYDLREHLPAFFGDGPPDTAARVMHDYRQTLAELHLAYISTWSAWTHSMHGLSREQAHGSPANLLDVYAAADIPETEVDWRTPIERQPPMLKFASSAAHITGKSLASSETFTWAGEHFQVSLADVKPIADYLFCTGINHIFFHGIPYSPADAPWPGWPFYAAVNFGPDGGLWHDMPAFTAYLTRCQSILQRGKPANDVLLYFPIDDIWQSRGQNPVIQFTTPGKWMWDQPFYTTAMKLWQRGFAFDEISDQLLASAKYKDGHIIAGGNSYRIIVVPSCQFMPPDTMRKLTDLARNGAVIIMEKPVPTDAPGLTKRGRESLSDAELLQMARVTDSEFLEATLNDLGISRETLVDDGLLFSRRLIDNGYSYFLTNRSNKNIDGWVPLSVDCKSAVIYDPLRENHIGLAAVKPSCDQGSEIYLQLAAGASCIIQTSSHQLHGQNSDYWQTAGAPTELTGAWQVHFLQGGPKLPADFSANHLVSWTTRDDPEAKRFAGTARYTLQFQAPEGSVDWVLDLGKVCESARVNLNGHDLGTLWCHPFALHISGLFHTGTNTIQIDVTNLAANRIADLDRRGVNWKSFHEINFVDRNYESFDASNWPERDSGLIGPVRLIPLHHMTIP